MSISDWRSDVCSSDRDQGGRVWPVDAGVDDGRHGGAGRAREVAESRLRALVRRPAGVGLDQQGVLALAGTFEQRGRHRGPGSGSGSGYGGADPPTQAYSASSPPSSSPLSPFSSFPAGWTWPPPGPTRTLRAGTTVEMACL